MDEKLKANLTSSEHWTRFIYMLLFAVFLYIAILLAAAVVTVQFIFALLTGGANDRLRLFGSELSAYMHQVWKFLMYNSEVKAFPFADWPEPELVASAAFEDVGEVSTAPVEPAAPVESAAPVAQTPPAADPPANASENKKKTAQAAANESAASTAEATEKSDN